MAIRVGGGVAATSGSHISTVTNLFTLNWSTLTSDQGQSLSTVRPLVEAAQSFALFGN